MIEDGHDLCIGNHMLHKLLLLSMQETDRDILICIENFEQILCSSAYHVECKETLFVEILNKDIQTIFNEQKVDGENK